MHKARHHLADRTAAGLAPWGGAAVGSGVVPAAGRCAACCDGALAAVLFVVPWCLGGRHPTGELVLVLLVLAAALAHLLSVWFDAAGARWRRSGADVLAPLAIGLLVVQLVAWPSQVQAALSPHMAHLLPLWGGGDSPGALGPWTSLSLTPAATASSLVMLVAYCLLFLVTLQRLDRLDDVERVLKWIATSTAVLAAFGLVHYLTSNGKFLWVYQHPFRYSDRAATGMFINKNHFAHLLALGVGPLVWCLVRSFGEPGTRLEHAAGRGRPWHRGAFALGLALTVFAGLLSLSRGGMLMMVLAGVVSGLLMHRAGLLSRRLVLTLAATLALVACSLAVHGYRAVADRLADYTAGSLSALDSDGGRRAIWRANLAAAGDFLLLGTGAGSHRQIYPVYMPEPFDTEFTHAENGYLQIALECGIPGLALLATALGYLGVYCCRALWRARTRRLYACVAAVAGGLSASAVHSLVDFVWYVPACLATTLMLAACAVRLWQLNRPDSATPAPAAGQAWSLAAVCGLCLVGSWMVHDRGRAVLAAPHWDAYLRFALRPEAKDGSAQPGAGEVQHLERVVAWTPGEPRAQLALAEACLQQFERAQQVAANAMPLAQIRDAALASNFASRAELDGWLARAVGENRRWLDRAAWHARQALAACPLEGQAYIYLAELCFLDGPRPQAKAALVDQALRVRPASGAVLMCAGSEAALAGQASLACQLWRRALHTGPLAQRKLVDMWVSAQVPAEFVLRVFEPPPDALRAMVARYDAEGDAEQVQPVLRALAERLSAAAGSTTSTEAARWWLEAQAIYRRLGQTADELAALGAAVQASPNDFAARRALAEALVRERQYASAEQHLRWCVERRPGDRPLRELLATSVKAGLGGGRVSITGERPPWR